MANFPMFQKTIYRSQSNRIIGFIDHGERYGRNGGNGSRFSAIGFPNNLRTEENYLILLDICKNSKYSLSTAQATLRLGEIDFALRKKAWRCLLYRYLMRFQTVT